MIQSVKSYITEGQIEYIGNDFVTTDKTDSDSYFLLTDTSKRVKSIEIYDFAPEEYKDELNKALVKSNIENNKRKILGLDTKTQSSFVMEDNNDNIVIILNCDNKQNTKGQRKLLVINKICSEQLKIHYNSILDSRQITLSMESCSIGQLEITKYKDTDASLLLSLYDTEVNDYMNIDLLKVVDLNVVNSHINNFFANNIDLLTSTDRVYELWSKLIYLEFGAETNLDLTNNVMRDVSRKVRTNKMDVDSAIDEVKHEIKEYITNRPEWSPNIHITFNEKLVHDHTSLSDNIVHNLTE